ncbi:MAG: hypothetical protein H6Q73_1294 [Firmicutes bacterium]|nr:hypothetical protein [Bacillota bacterium]
MEKILRMFLFVIWIFLVIAMPGLLEFLNNSYKYILVFPTFTKTFYLLTQLILLIVVVGKYRRNIDGIVYLILFTLCQVFFWSFGYGHITDKEISYRSARNLFVTKVVSLDSIQSPAIITINAYRGRYSYSCKVVIKEENGEENLDLFGIVNDQVLKAKAPVLIKEFNKRGIKVEVVETDEAKKSRRNAEENNFINELHTLSGS